MDIEKILTDIQIEEITLSNNEPQNLKIPIHDVFSPINSVFSNKIYYISDVHLIHKIKKSISDYSYDRIYSYIDQIIKQFTNNIDEYLQSPYNGPLLLVGGDISSDFTITKLFYSILSLYWRPERIIAILGNHELWGFNCNLEEIIQQYRLLFADLNITFLHNEILLVDKRISTSNESLFKIENEKTIKLSLDDFSKLNNTQKKQIYNNYCKTSFIIIGGLGYSGLSKNYNATTGIYRNAITSLEQDMQETEKFSSLYKTVLHYFKDKQVIVFSHTPKDNWTTLPFNPGWIYVNGHTHHNHWEAYDGSRIYSDNQIGYYSTNFSLKYFYLDTLDYDIFQHYKDGHYTITSNQYNDFNRGIGLRGKGRTDGVIHMLKHSGIYCFFLENEQRNKYYLLNGGRINNIKYQDLNYYYDNMVIYSDLLKQSTKLTQEKLIKISKAIKQIGGSGRIHGSIVDIDFFNHIYLNIFDGSITPYFASSLTNKYCFESVPHLLKETTPKLYKNYIKLLETNTEYALSLKQTEKKSSITEYLSTDIYKPSRLMLKIQALLNKNVIRVWDEELFDSITNNKRLNN